MRTVLCVAAILTLSSCSRQEPSPAQAAGTPPPAAAPNFVTLDPATQRAAGIAVEPAAQRSIPETVRANARLTNDEDRTWRVGAITDGRVVYVMAAPGDFVEQGKPLARLHSHEIHDSRAQFRNAVSELQRAKATVAYAAKARDRARRLLELKAASQEQVEHAETELRNAEAAQATAETEVARHRAHLEEFLGVPAEQGGHQHQPGMESDENDLIPVRAPASGTVITRNVTQGAVVTPAVDLFVISNLETLWAIAEVNEEHLGKLRPGMPARVYVQAWSQEPFSGRIAKLGESLDPQTRTVKVRIVLPNKAGRLKPEMYATAEIDVGGSKQSIFVPAEAVQEVRGQAVVFVRVDEKRFEARPVETGRTIGGAIEVVRGIRPGETVASRGAFVLKSEHLKASLAGE
jgi:multidrug efflux pump subunit AcrA (membrane-fusion protein)